MQIWPWSTEEAGQRIIEFCQENALVIPNTSSNDTREDSTHGHHQMVNTEIKTDYILCSQRWRSSIQSAKKGLVADYGSDHELLIAKFRFKLNKVGRLWFFWGENAREYPGGLLRLEHAFAYAEPPSS